MQKMIEITVVDKITREEMEDYCVAWIYGGDTAYIDYSCRSDVEGYFLDCDGGLWLMGDGKGEIYPLRIPPGKYLVKLKIWDQEFVFENR